MIPEATYKEGWSQESHGPHGHLGIKILVSMVRSLTDVDKRVLRQAVAQVQEVLEAETIRLDPSTAENRAEERAAIVGLFDGVAIYVEEIPNGYCSQYCCLQKPWFVVTTKRGRIQLGWRKRVIQINWAGSDIESRAEELFTGEDVTKGDKMIHAWSYLKAQLYLKTLLDSK